MNSVLTTLVALLTDAALPFIGGLLLGTAIEVFLPRSWTERWLSGGPRSLLLATLAGALLPGCAMSTVPVARSLRARGAPLGTVAAFLLIAPLISPHTVVLTAALLGAGFAVARVVLPLLFTLAFGTIANALARPPAGPPARAGAAPAEAEASCGCGTTDGCGCHADDDDCSDASRCGCGGTDAHPPPPASATGRFVRKFFANLRLLAPLFVGSLVVVAVLGAVVNPVRIAEYGNGPLAYGAALAAGIPLYVCDGGEVPLTLSLLKLGVGPGPAFTFLLGSVGTCIATITMAFAIIGRRLTVAYVAGTLLLALLGGLLVAASPWLHPLVTMR